MKQRSTTPVSTGLTTKVIIVASAVLMIISAPLAMVPTAKADKFDDQINALQQQINQFQAEAGKFRDQANTLQSKVDSLNNEKAQIQARIDLNQAQYDKLQEQIKKTKEDIVNNQNALGDTLADLYVDDAISPLEMLASSKNIGDYVDKQEYRSSVRDQLTGTIEKIKQLKKQLDKQKIDLEEVLNNQKRSRDALAAAQAEQQKLLDETKGQESAYQQLSSQSEQQKLKVQQEQQAAITAASGGLGGIRFIGGGDGGYPWNSSNCFVDQYAMSHGGSNGNGGDGWGYGCRQCASYAAWKIGERTGVIPTNIGDAIDFPAAYPNRIGGAHANSVGVITIGGRPGHVVWVESEPVNGYITVSQYNANYSGASNNWGNFTRVSVPVSTYNKFINF